MRDLPGVDWQSGTKSSQFNQFAVQGYVGPNKLPDLMDRVHRRARGRQFSVARQPGAVHGQTERRCCTARRRAVWRRRRGG